LFVDINLRPPWWQLTQISTLLERVQLLKLNEHELMQLVPDAESLQQAMEALIDERNIQLLVVTRGEQGVMAADALGDVISAVPQPATRVMDTVGAGDAFSSVLLLGQHRGWSLPDCLQRAQAFASAIVGIQGATINDKSFYQPFIADWQL
jgi:fructokinase